MRFKRIVCGIVLCFILLMVASCSTNVKVSGNKLIPDGTIKSATIVLYEGLEEKNQYNCKSEQIQKIVDAVNEIDYVDEDPGALYEGAWSITLRYADDSETIIVLQSPYMRIYSQNSETRSLKTQKNSAEQLYSLLKDFGQ
ncbi:MAG: hypothetical protein K6F14_05615 [Clostridiales bacterium]|nr:hypothetical protein [Clostridiales bacterium]